MPAQQTPPGRRLGGDRSSARRRWPHAAPCPAAALSRWVRVTPTRNDRGPGITLAPRFAAPGEHALLSPLPGPAAEPPGAASEGAVGAARGERGRGATGSGAAHSLFHLRQAAGSFPFCCPKNGNSASSPLPEPEPRPGGGKNPSRNDRRRCCLGSAMPRGGARPEGWNPTAAPRTPNLPGPCARRAAGGVSRPRCLHAPQGQMFPLETRCSPLDQTDVPPRDQTR